MKTSNQIIRAELTDAVVAAVGASPAQPSNLEKRRIAEEVIAQAAPVILNQTNNEPWWQSRVTIGSLLAVLSGVLGIFGYALPDELRGQILEIIVAAGPVIGGAIAIYGRWIAKKPIGA